MNELLRRAAAHVLVGDVDAPELDDATAHHVFRVLRVRDGEAVTVTDGGGRWRPCRAVGGSLEVDGPVRAERIDEASSGRAPFALYVAIPKQDRPEWLVQKATELGVGRIVFVHADHSVVRWNDDRVDRHIERLRSVAVAAAMQSRRIWLPIVEGPAASADILGSVPVAEPEGRPQSIDDRALAVGPEGGWSERELSLAADRVSLGPHILRVETAALAACVRASTTG